MLQAELILAENGVSSYQIVVPDASPSLLIDAWLEQVARLVQAAFTANGCSVTVTNESARDLRKPGIYLGNTSLARAAGIGAASFDGWGYAHKVVGRDVLIVGHDHNPPGDDPGFFQRLGTAKGSVDFLREYAGVRFLYPDISGNMDPKSNPAAVGRVDLATSPAIEFLKTPKISVPDDLDIRHAPLVRNNVGQRNLSFWAIANNMFPAVDDALLAHTWDKAVTVEADYEKHPDWFALIGGERVKRGQFCLSNPGFQERLYQWTRGWLDKGFKSVNLLQPDGFQPCQCKACYDLYDTGGDWGEKMWIFNLKIAERLKKEVPGGILSPIPYGPVAHPPKTFNAFPDNVVLQFIGTNEKDLEEWKHIKLPAGITSGVHNWIQNLGTRYTPMRTPLFLEEQAKRFHQYHITSTFRDGVGVVYGLEGPCYYIWGRMFDDPATNRASDLMLEFVEAGFGNAAAPMRRFYDQLYHGIELYSNYLGTRCPGWNYTDIYGRGHKSLSDPFQLLGFLYTPSLLANLEKELAQAEKLPSTDKVHARLTLVRREFDFVKALARVIHLYHAYETAPESGAVKELLLNAIDARNAMINGFYDERGRAYPMPGWPGHTFFPPSGFSAGHLRLEYNEYQGPFKDTALNWDTAAMRAAPQSGEKQMSVSATGLPFTLDDPRWAELTPQTLAALPGAAEPTVQTTVCAAYDQEKLYLRFVCQLPAMLINAKDQKEKTDLKLRESLDVYLAPLPGQEVYYRFMGGLKEDDRTDAARGLISDLMNLRYGQDDPDWNGEWDYSVRLDPDGGRWTALFTIPFKTLGAEPPVEGTFWRANFGRVHVVDPKRLECMAWTASGPTGMDDVKAFGGLKFEPMSISEQSRKIRREQGYSVVPPAWGKLIDPLPADAWGIWKCRTDSLEQGLRDGWQKPDADETGWSPVPVPAWFEETSIGPYKGIAWYRLSFTVPAAWKGKTLRIQFAAVDEEAWVYLNGQQIREHTAESEGKTVYELYDLPFSADAIPSALVYGGRNVLVVRMRNIVGSGGISRPVFIHAIEQKK